MKKRILFLCVALSFFSQEGRAASLVLNGSSTLLQPEFTEITKQGLKIHGTAGSVRFNPLLQTAELKDVTIEIEFPPTFDARFFSLFAERIIVDLEGEDAGLSDVTVHFIRKNAPPLIGETNYLRYDCRRKVFSTYEKVILTLGKKKIQGENLLVDLLSNKLTFYTHPKPFTLSLGKDKF